MAVIELEPVFVEDTDEDTSSENHDGQDEKFCHLYLKASAALCGLPAHQDWHAKIHPPRSWHKGELSCPVCGTPICMDCVLIAS